jgi:hypothetical protein
VDAYVQLLNDPVRGDANGAHEQRRALLRTDKKQEKKKKQSKKLART